MNKKIPRCKFVTRDKLLFKLYNRNAVVLTEEVGFKKGNQTLFHFRIVSFVAGFHGGVHSKLRESNIGAHHTGMAKGGGAKGASASYVRTVEEGLVFHFRAVEDHFE